MEEVDHARNSLLRELIVEHLFIGEVLRLSWSRGVTDLEVLRSESDSFGYDLVIARGSVVRHVQMKTMSLGGKAAEVKVALRLAEKPSGCVLWVVLDPELRFDHFLWFGGGPGEPLPDLSGYKTARHTKGDATGYKAERPAHRIVPKSQFKQLPNLQAVVAELIGTTVDS